MHSNVEVDGKQMSKEYYDRQKHSCSNEDDNLFINNGSLVYFSADREMSNARGNLYCYPVIIIKNSVWVLICTNQVSFVWILIKYHNSVLLFKKKRKKKARQWMNFNLQFHSSSFFNSGIHLFPLMIRQRGLQFYLYVAIRQLLGRSSFSVITEQTQDAGLPLLGNYQDIRFFLVFTTFSITLLPNIKFS